MVSFTVGGNRSTRKKTPHYRNSHTPVSSWSYYVVSRTPLFDLELTIEAILPGTMFICSNTRYKSKRYKIYIFLQRLHKVVSNTPRSSQSMEDVSSTPQSHRGWNTISGMFMVTHRLHIFEFNKVCGLEYSASV